MFSRTVNMLTLHDNSRVVDATTRYVAQENVILQEPEQLDDEDIQGFPIEIGKWFTTYSEESGTFVSNVRDEYPED